MRPKTQRVAAGAGDLQSESYNRKKFKRLSPASQKNFPEIKAVCTGCGRSDVQTGEYTDEDPVTNDGTYAQDRFVCTECYCRLIDAGLDVGEPEILQRRAERLSRAEK